MIINFLGDSITFGAGASCDANCFVSLLKKRFPNHKVLNYGLGGTRIARQYELTSEERSDVTDANASLYNLDFLLRAESMQKGDYIFVFGGTNDFGHGVAPFGEISDKTPLTFSGAVRCLIQRLLKDYKKECIKFILPIYRIDDDISNAILRFKHPISKKTLTEYRKRIVEIANEYDVEIIDIREAIGRPISDKNEGNFFDGLHPNDNGHMIIANEIAKIIEKL